MPWPIEFSGNPEDWSTEQLEMQLADWGIVGGMEEPPRVVRQPVGKRETRVFDEWVKRADR